MSCPVKHVQNENDVRNGYEDEEDLDHEEQSAVDETRKKQSKKLNKKDKVMLGAFITFTIFIVVELLLEVTFLHDGSIREGRLVRSLLWDLGKLHHDHDLIMSSCSHDPSVNTTAIYLKDKLEHFHHSYKHVKKHVIGLDKTSEEYKAFAEAYSVVKNVTSVVPICDDQNILIEESYEASNNKYLNTVSKYRKSIQDAIQIHLVEVSTADIFVRLLLWAFILSFMYFWKQLEAWDPEEAAKRKLLKPKNSFIHEIAVPIVVADKLMHIKDVNNAATSVFGWTKSEMIGQNVTLLMPETLHKNHYKYVSYFLKTKKGGIIGNTTGRPIPGVHKDGSDLHLIINISVSGSDQESNPLFTAVLQDVTQQVQAQEAGKKKQQEMALMVENQQKLLDHLHAPVCIASYDMIILKANLACQQVFEYTEDELVGQNVKMLMFKEDADQHDTRVGHYKTTGEKRVIGKSRRIFGKTKSGSRLDLILNMAETKDAKGTQYIAIFHDMTEKKGHAE